MASPLEPLFGNPMGMRCMVSKSLKQMSISLSMAVVEIALMSTLSPESVLHWSLVVRSTVWRLPSATLNVGLAN